MPAAHAMALTLGTVRHGGSAVGSGALARAPDLAASAHLSTVVRRMIEAADRQPFLEALRPPDGYAFQSAIATTCSLDLAALLEAAAVLGGEANEASPSALLEGALRVGENLHVFCQSGAVRVPPPGRRAVVGDGGIGGRGARAARVASSIQAVDRPLPVATTPQVPIAYGSFVGTRNLTLERGW